MDENNKDSFWEKSNDDFWNRPVVDNTWLENADSDKTDENPYLKKEIDNIEKNPDQKALNNPYQSIDASLYEQNTYHLNGTPYTKNKRQIHIHTIICLSFIGIAILCIIFAVCIYSGTKSKAIAKAKEITFQKTICESRSVIYDANNFVEIQDAVKILSKENFTGFPEGKMLISIPISITSEKYITGTEVMKDLYIGYSLEGYEYFQTLPRESTVYPYVSVLGYRKEEILGNYGLGNGISDEGYLFFFIPEEVENITLYMPKTKSDSGIKMITEILCLNIPVIHMPRGEEEYDETGN